MADELRQYVSDVLDLDVPDVIADMIVNYHTNVMTSILKSFIADDIIPDIFYLYQYGPSGEKYKLSSNLAN